MAYEDEIEQKITGKTFDDCKNKLFKLYGRDYHITNKTVEFRPGGFLFLQNKPVTVVKYVVNHPKSYNPESVITSYAQEVKKPSEEELLAQNREALLKSLQNSNANNQFNQFNKVLEDFKDEMSRKIDGLSVSAQDKHESIKKIEELLAANEFSFSFISMIDDKIKNDFSLEQLENFDLVERRTVDWIGDSIKITKQVVLRPPHVYILVGPTGVGKTTTLVKLAVQFMKKYALANNGDKPRICFINTDYMRVGATEQLERWASHMNSQIYKAERPEDLKEIYEQYKNDVDAMFIDTSGFSPNDATHIAKMKMLLDVPGMNPDIYLAMMASTKTYDLMNIMQNYEPFGYKSVIITKCDESNLFGNIISALYEKHKAIAYITNGQVASRDIAEASVIEFLKRLKDFKVDRVHIEDKFGE